MFSFTAAQRLQNELEQLKTENADLKLQLAEAQQWIDSEPDWKDKFMANYKKLQDENAAIKAKLAVAEMDVPITQYLFQDQIESTQPEIDFWTSLDNRSGPFILEEMNHNNQKGATTLCYQSGKLVGFTINCRDEMNWTILICAAIAAKPKE